MLRLWFFKNEALAYLIAQRGTHLQHAALEVDIAPALRQQLALAHPGRESQHVKRGQSFASTALEQVVCLLGVSHAHLMATHPWRLDGVGDIARNHAQAHRMRQTTV
jgi:hypothetical protein